MKQIGFHLSLFGVATVLIWIGLFKFTPSEARAIEPLVRHAPLMRWMYGLMSVQGVSNAIGILEVVTGVLLLAYYILPYAGLAGGLMASVTFLLTLSFIITTPDAIDRIDGFILPDPFIMKDIVLLGASLTVFMRAWQKVFSMNSTG